MSMTDRCLRIDVKITVAECHYIDCHASRRCMRLAPAKQWKNDTNPATGHRPGPTPKRRKVK